jgi:hypothetical protein
MIRASFAESLLMIRPLAIVLPLLLSPALAAAALAADPLTGAQIQAQIVGNTVDGTAGDVEYTEFYAADGTIHGLGDDGPYAGQWSIENDHMCFDLGETKECDKVQLDGTKVQLFADDGSLVAVGELKPGNPGNL